MAIFGDGTAASLPANRAVPESLIGPLSKNVPAPVPPLGGPVWCEVRCQVMVTVSAVGWAAAGSETPSAPAINVAPASGTSLPRRNQERLPFMMDTPIPASYGPPAALSVSANLRLPHH